MIRAYVDKLEALRVEHLPDGAPCEQVRVLFLSQVFAGFGTYAGVMRRYAAERDDLDALFIDLSIPKWISVVGKSIPILRTRGWDFHSFRHLRLWRRALLNAIRKGPLDLRCFDVVHVMTQGAAMFIPDVKNHTSARFAVNIDGTARQDVDEFNFSPLARRPFICAEQRIFNACDLIVCRNRFAPDSLLEDYHIDPAKILVARNSIDPSARSRRDGSRDHEGPVRLVYVGNDIVRKGLPELIRAHQQHLADRAELHIVTADEVSTAGLRRVVMHGQIDRRILMDDLLPTMDVFVMWTRRDHHPWAILEAASVGLPVVSTKIAAISDLVRHDETGFLAAPLDWSRLLEYTTRLVDDAALRERFGRAAREHIRHEFNPDIEFTKLLDALVDLGTNADPARLSSPMAGLD